MTIKRYNIPFTDTRAKPIVVPRKVFVEDVVDIALIGKTAEEYGQAFNENLLKLLEHFACPASLDDENVPATTNKISNAFENPIAGQLWYNQTNKKMYVWNGTMWERFNTAKSIIGNSGMVLSGEYIPVPYDANNVPFQLSRCAISLSPAVMYDRIKSFVCEVDASGLVTCTYTDMDDVTHDGYATYLIICS